MKLTQLFLCSAALALPQILHAATEKNNDRWFEVEVILFSQLGDKSQLKESFPETSKLPKYQRVEDLLAQYLNPDIRTLKQLLPACDAPQREQKTAFDSAKLAALFNEKSLTEIIASSAQIAANETTEQNPTATTDNSSFSDNTNVETLATTLKTDTGDALATDNLPVNTQHTFTDSNTLPLKAELSLEEREKINQLVLAAEAKFQQIKFRYTPSTDIRLLCKIDQQFFAEYQANNPDFDYYGFSVDKMPLRIDAIENIENDNTHLLSSDSLQLSDIISDLRYSKNFKPLLHMGWRQVARPQKQSVPVKVYAGDNFYADYQKQLRSFNNQQQIAQLRQATNDELIQTELNADSPSSAEIAQSQALQFQRAQQALIAEIIAQLPQVSDNTEALLTNLESDDLSLKYIGKNAATEIKPTPPLPPIQQWFIDGFFNIHLKHYLFITADFNILDKSLSELATEKLTTATVIDAYTGKSLGANIQAKPIRFKQDRRVISGEVHYFDHPYMGMIVQIRPYTKPEPEIENEQKKLPSPAN